VGRWTSDRGKGERRRRRKPKRGKDAQMEGGSDVVDYFVEDLCITQTLLGDLDRLEMRTRRRKNREEIMARTKRNETRDVEAKQQ